MRLFSGGIMRIDVSDEVGSELVRLSKLFEMSEDAILRKLLKLPVGSAAQEPTGIPVARFTHEKKKNNATGGETAGRASTPRKAQGYRLCRACKEWENRRGGNYWKICLPSPAAIAIAQRPINGWSFWDKRMAFP